MRRILAAAAAIAMTTAACSSAKSAKHTGPAASTAGTSAAATSTAPVPGSSTATGVSAADVALIVAMYDTINRAFHRNPDDGVRAIIAAQYPGDLADVGFARCISAIVPGATTLPRSKALRFVAKVSSITPDPGYTLTSSRVRGLHPKGRIYMTQMTITQGRRTSVRVRHQVIRNGKAYQFSQC